MPHNPPGKRPRRTDPDQVRHDVLQALATGIPLAVVARRNGVTQPIIAKWMARDPTLADDIAAARSLGWDHLATECLDIADDTSGDILQTEEGPRPNTANVLSRRLMIDTRLKLLAKWDSGRYGDSAKLTVEGSVQATVRHVLDPAAMDEAGRDALRAVLAHAQAQGLIAGPGPVDAEFEDVEEGLGPQEDVADA